MNNLTDTIHPHALPDESRKISADGDRMKPKIKMLALVFFICFLVISPCIALEPISTVTPTQSPLPGITTAAISPAPTQSPEVQDNTSASVVRPKSVDESGSLTKGEEKISTALLLETNETAGNPGVTHQESDAGLQTKIVPVPPAPTGEGKKIPSGKLVYVYITTRPGYSTHCVDSLVADVKNRNEDYHLVVGWADVANLESIAKLEGVQNIRQVVPPRVHKGINTTQGDIIHKTANVRSTYGYTGSGMKIGILSDGVDHLADSQATGDLPANVHVLSNTLGGDEGTAMLEIVYDMVPDADLYFHDCGTDVLGFNDAIADLKAAGCTVICDDIGWLEEPFFEDGIVASNITTLLASNPVIYVSAAGNDADSHYQGAFYDRGTGYTDFSLGTNATRKSLYVQLLPNASVYVVLEWDDQFGHSGNDYNLYLSNADNSTFTYGDLAYSENVQSGSGNPLETLTYTNTGNTTINGTIDVFKYHGVTKTLELFIYRGGRSTTIYPDNIVAADSVFGHPAVPDVIAAAAVNQSTPSSIERFSSRGPVTIAYPSAVLRPKPDIAGVDGVNITGAGGFPNPFYGTSAAAPHISAVVAQIWGAHRELTPAQVRSALYNSAVHLGTAGKNSESGYGRADALAMATLTLPVVSVGPDGGDEGPVSLVRKTEVSRTEIVNVGGGSAITRASMTGTGLGKNLVITAMPRSTLPSTMAAPQTTVYQYMSITTSTITGVVSETTLDFVVPQAWLTDHGFEESDIVMLHNVDGKWQALSTRIVSRSGDSVFYRATTPGFSYFAIAYQKGGTDMGLVTPVPTPAPTAISSVAVTTASETNAPVPVYSSAPVARTPAVTGTVPPSPVPAPAEALPLATIAVGLFGVLVIIIIAFLVRRWWIRQQNPALFRKYD